MKPIINREEYRKSANSMFGKFPFLLLLVTWSAVFLSKAIRELIVTGTLVENIQQEKLGNTFFQGVLGAVIIFYIARMVLDQFMKKAFDLSEESEKGYYLPCMRHNSWHDFSVGNLIVKKNQFYFQPDRQMSMILSFNYESANGFTAELSKKWASIGLYLITKEKYMLVIRDQEKKVVGKFIVADVSKHLPTIQTMLK
ncbi:hypothetical protein [Petrocella sp. FN5]|uniref:hypothetical protein n=1 Tax=Petrocella sp. FN5 TaxID=3032002 RepID=UPI0023DBDEA5|nr:hypothetical protein [Petrocella sp. FN5]MDF1617679.1 hypothetical protein [Petrocella sp. FN5]